MASDHVLYGAPGWGSALAEAMLVLCGVPWRAEDVAGFDRPGPARDRLAAVNPLAQVPTLVLPDGRTMTESAAIALHLGETHPGSGLCPPPDAPDRPAFLRWLLFLAAAVYPTFTYADYPERFAPSAPAELAAGALAWRERLWRQAEAAVADGSWPVGERITALDVYVATMTRWRPGPDWFRREAPRLDGLARRCREDARLRDVWARNFPDG